MAGSQRNHSEMGHQTNVMDATPYLEACLSPITRLIQHTRTQPPTMHHYLTGFSSHGWLPNFISYLAHIWGNATPFLQYQSNGWEGVDQACEWLLSAFKGIYNSLIARGMDQRCGCNTWFYTTIASTIKNVIGSIEQSGLYRGNYVDGFENVFSSPFGMKIITGKLLLEAWIKYVDAILDFTQP